MHDQPSTVWRIDRIEIKRLDHTAPKTHQAIFRKPSYSEEGKQGQIRIGEAQTLSHQLDSKNLSVNSDKFGP
jgi:hypothetical protein